MVEDENLYRNIIKFLEDNGFNVFFINSEKIAFEFKDSVVLTAYDKFNNFMSEAETIQDLKKKNEIFKKAWAELVPIQETYYPKLQPILDVLNNFYKNRDTQLEFILFFNNNYLPNLSIGGNLLYQEVLGERELFLQKISNELQELDSFIDKY
jgi:hypothetical protein